MNAPDLKNIDDLYGLFGETAPEAVQVAADDAPQPERGLLAHENHMTVTLERHHQTSVELGVLSRLHQGHSYARKIVLLHPQSRRVLQFGIMQFDLRCVSEEIGHDIVTGRIPLGRILIRNQTLRSISLHGLLRIQPDHEMRLQFGLSRAWSGSVYGRLATIYCEGNPAVDLLEVVTPTASPST